MNHRLVMLLLASGLLLEVACQPGMGGMDPAMLQQMMGGMGGGAGGMGGMGGPPQQKPPPPMQIGVKTARKLLEELLTALEPVKEELLKARGDADENSRQAMQSILDRASQGLMDKYKFKGGINEAMASVQEAGSRKGCPIIKEKFAAVVKLITGQTPPDEASGNDAAMDGDAGEQKSEKNSEL